MPFLALIFALRLAADGLTGTVVVIGTSLALLPLFVVLARWLPNRWPATGLLAVLALIATGTHATQPGSEFALGHLGILAIGGTFLLDWQQFRAYSLFLLALATASRGIRLYLGLEDVDAMLAPSVNLIVALIAFIGALWVLEHRHLRVTAALEYAVRRARYARVLAQRAARAKGRFLANMSHELRTPMNAILGYAEILADEVDEPANQPALEAIRAAGLELLLNIDIALEQAREDHEDSKLYLAGSRTPTLSDELEDVEKVDLSAPLPSVATSEVFLRRGLVTAGVMLIVATLVGAIVGAPFHHVNEWVITFGALALGAGIIALGRLGKTREGVIVTLSGTALVLAYAWADMEPSYNTPFQMFFVSTLAAAALPFRRFVLFEGVVLALLVPGGARRVALGWAEPFEVAIPTLILVLVMIGLTARVRMRTGQLDRLDGQLGDATRALERAAASDRARNAFIEQMSHQLRTPLTTVLGYAELLEDELDDPSREDASRIRRAGAHLLGIFDAIHDVRKMAVGEVPYQPVVVDSHEIARQAVELSRPGIEANGNRLVLEASASHRFHGDPKLLNQVLVNLLGNAGKYTEQGEVRLTVSEQDGSVRFAVQDTGSGIPAALLERLFLPFERLKDHSTIGGTGLGLTIARQLADLHGGSISAHSEVGVGSTFVLEIPCLTPTSPAGTDESTEQV